ncbi:hypothetical protein NPIL_75901 [Nephila pilipes]|uniref:Uncharacterized protein n=1 Tax=Nephila pilipes TaxID=299642 RepID=A0A8X6N5I5_NEPPI|nr:hypothetical protein NPIL_75901 [Nephila pilipes]
MEFDRGNVPPNSGERTANRLVIGKMFRILCTQSPLCGRVLFCIIEVESRYARDIGHWNHIFRNACNAPTVLPWFSFTINELSGKLLTIVNQLRLLT